MLIIRNRNVVVEVVRLAVAAAAVLVMTAVVVTRSESALADPTVRIAVDDRPAPTSSGEPVEESTGARPGQEPSDQ